MKGSVILMNVQFDNRQTKYPVDEWRALLARVLPHAMNEVFLGRLLQRRGDEAAVTVIFAGPRQMRRINRDTRRVDDVTDVLSFPMLDMAEGHLTRPLASQDYDPQSPDQRQVPLGDIVICLDRAIGQAAEYGHPLPREVAFLAVHGLLHLLGYDHRQIDEEKKMRRMQKRILDRSGLGRGETNV